MKVSEVTIKNILGIRELTLRPGGKLTEIRGRNGAGKSSVLEALRVALGGGSIATMARVGADAPPEYVVVLDDGTRKRQKGNGASVVEVAVDTSAGTAYAAIKKPQAHFDALIDTRLMNPVRFVTAPPAERAELLLAALPLELDLAALWEELPPAGRKALEAVDVKGHPLQVLGAARARVFELRTDINRTHKEKSASAEQLAASLPKDGDRDWAADIADWERDHRALDESRRAKLVEAGTIEQKMLAGIEESRALSIQTAKNGQEVAAEKLRADRDAKLEGIRQEYEAALAELAKGAAAAIETITSESDAAKVAAADIRHEAEQGVRETEPELQRLAAQIATARTKAAEAGRVQATREMAETFRREADGMKAHAEELTAAIETLDAAKAALAKSLPIPGLELEGRDIKVDGIPFDAINTAKKWRIGFKVTTLRAGKLPIAFIDDMEHLDSDNYEALVAEAEAAGIQLFVTRVEDCDLTIVTDGEAVATA